MTNPDPQKSRYRLTHDDIIAINEMMDVTYAFHLKVSADRGEHAKKCIFMFAPGRDNTWYVGQGETVCEATDKWFEKTLLRRWDISAHRIERGWDYIVPK